MSDIEDEYIKDEDIIEKEGRKPYNKSLLRKAAEGYEDRQPPDTYISWQSKINTAKGGKINKKVLDPYLVNSGYEEVNLKDIDMIPTGSRLAYITKDKKWRSAGWLSRVEDSYEDVDGNPFDKPKKYILYKAYNNAAWSIQLEDIYKLYIMRNKSQDILVKKVIYFRKPTKRTNFAVYLNNSKGEDVVIYYAKDNFDKKRFMNTNKYQISKEDPEGWLFDDNTQEIDL